MTAGRRPTMQALRWRGRGDVAVEAVPVPTPAPDEALIAVAWSGICGSDLEEFRDGPVVVTGPVTLGHEIVGRVAVAAADGSGPAVGTRVVVDVVTGCGRCWWCRRHEEGLCPDLVVTGQHVDGGLAEFVVGRADRLIAVPDGLDSRHAALAEPAAVAVRAVGKVGDPAGLGAVVLGGGTIGLLVAQVLRARGAAPVVVVEPDAGRRAVAAALGLTAIWDEDVVGRFPVRGVDLVVECSGAPGAPDRAIGLAGRGGTVVLLGVPPEPEPVDTAAVVLRELTVLGSAAHMWDTDVALAVQLIASGAIDVEPLITGELPLADAASAFERPPAAGALKVLIGPGDAGEPAAG